MKLQYAFKLTGITDVMNYSKIIAGCASFLEFVMKLIFLKMYLI